MVSNVCYTAYPANNTIVRNKVHFHERSGENCRKWQLFINLTSRFKKLDNLSFCSFVVVKSRSREDAEENVNHSFFCYFVVLANYFDAIFSA